MKRRTLIDVTEFPPVTNPLARFRTAWARVSDACAKGRLADAEQHAREAAQAAVECATALCDFLGRRGR